MVRQCVQRIEVCADDLAPILSRALLAKAWQEREKHLAAAYELVAAMHNRLGITEPLSVNVSSFFGRPFLVIHLGGSFADAIRASITDPVVKRIAGRKLVGSIDQISDSTDILSDPQWRTTLRRLYE
jgi:hypothetical protein